MTASIDRDLVELLDLGDRIVRMATDRGGSDFVAECVLRSGAELSAKVRMGETELVEEAGTRSAGLRVIQKGRVASTTTSDLTPAPIERFVSDAIELVALSQEDPLASPADPALLCDPAKTPELDLYDPAGRARSRRRPGHRHRERGGGRGPRLRPAHHEQRGRHVRSLLGWSGRRPLQRLPFDNQGLVPVSHRGARRPGRRRKEPPRISLDGSASPVRARSRRSRLTQEAARRTLRKLGARTVATCTVPVVFDPDSARALLGMFAGCVMGSSIWRKSSYLAGREGTRVASDLVTIVDDPLIPRAPGSRPFDGEGLASRVNTVVENGVLRTYLCDSYSARKLGRASTASASRGGGAGVGPSTSNFVLRQGTDSNAAIIKSTRQGLYVTEMMGFGFNAVTGDFSRGASGFWIENGELAYPVSEVTVSLNVDELWKSVDAVGSDLDMRERRPLPPPFAWRK